MSYSRVSGEAMGFPKKVKEFREVESFEFGGREGHHECHDKCHGAAAVLSSALIDVGLLGSSSPLPLNLVASTPDFQFDKPGAIIIKECGKYFITLTVAIQLAVGVTLPQNAALEVVKTDCKGRRQTIAFLNPNILNIAGVIELTLEGSSGPFYDCLNPGDRLEVFVNGLADVTVSAKVFIAKIACCCDDIKCDHGCPCKHSCKHC